MQLNTLLCILTGYTLATHGNRLKFKLFVGVHHKRNTCLEPYHLYICYI